MSLDVETRKLLDELSASTRSPLHELTPAEFRGLDLAELPGVAPEVRSSKEITIDGVDGHELTIRILTPADQQDGVIVFLHGGGWVLGSLNEYDAFCRELANRSGLAVAVVAYRLAPEDPFPAAAEDSWAALKWVSKNLETITVAGAPIVVAGDSAGGNLAAVTAQRAASTGEIDLVSQVLIYPMIDSNLTTASHRNPENQCLLTTEIVAWFWDHYVPDSADRTDPRVAPLHGELTSNLAPLIVLSCRYDVLLDEINEYADRLEQEGVEVVRRHYVDQMHGFITLIGVLPRAVESAQYIADQLQTYLK
jgi:acetyl esterase